MAGAFSVVFKNLLHCQRLAVAVTSSRAENFGVLRSQLIYLVLQNFFKKPLLAVVKRVCLHSREKRKLGVVKPRFQRRVQLVHAQIPLHNRPADSAGLGEQFAGIQLMTTVVRSSLGLFRAAKKRVHGLIQVRALALIRQYRFEESI
jgi:hypothetical protein